MNTLGKGQEETIIWSPTKRLVRKTIITPEYEITNLHKWRQNK